jgi:ubiquinone/menaquinone biosynthesis C-methylase UbiE
VYDERLVPVLFAPWAERLAADPTWVWRDRTVVDVATGTGIVVQALATAIGPQGRILATDINPEMLQWARRRCAHLGSRVRFIESPACALDIADACADVVVCQQGLQFFEDRDAAAREMLRVLRPGGRIHVSTWLPVDQQPFFQGMAEALAAVGHTDIADVLRLPFDCLPEEALVRHFEAAGLESIDVQRQQVDMLFPEGVEQVVSTCYATAVGGRLVALARPTQQAFRAFIRARFRSTQTQAGCRIASASHVLSGRKGES